jgi:chorismate dehydratase
MNQSNRPDLPRIAASSYLNTAPLIWSFIHGSQRPAVQLFTDKAPARCAEMLERDEVDVALVPIIEYQRMSDVLMIPDVCVGSRKAVHSVVLVTRRNNLKKVARVVLDNSSRTSVALLKIIFREFLGFDPEWKVAAPDLKSMLQEADAALIIGDPAMKIPRDQFHVFDLATMWREFTGFGFVFAMWMARSERAELARSVNFAAARDEGLRQLDEIAANYEALGLTRDEVRKYLTENIAFRVDEELAQGMNLYFDLAAKHKLVEVRKKLKFVW